MTHYRHQHIEEVDRQREKMQMQAPPTQKCGYVDVKQPNRIKARKLKNWKRRFAALTLLNDLSRGGKPLAKLDLFENESKWQRNSSDRVTFVLENVTSVGDAKSKSHLHALEIVERHSVLMLSGDSDIDTYRWMLTLRHMLVPSQVQECKGNYRVRVLPNEDSIRCGLSGDYTMYVTPQHLELVNTSGLSTINWSLSTLMRFDSDSATELTIISGKNSATGESIFNFSCKIAKSALKTIKMCVAHALMQRDRRQEQEPQQPARKPSPTNSATSPSHRSRTISSTVSEKGYQSLLDNMTLGVRFDRSDSDSSAASLPLQPPHPVPLPLSPTLLALPTFETAGNGGSGLGGELMFLEERDFSPNTESNGVKILLRNSSHSSVGSISPVILRNNVQLADLDPFSSAREQSIQVNGGSPAASVVSSSPVEGAGVGGSPTNRSKRSSDNPLISTSELEAVLERDENSVGFSGSQLHRTHATQPVTFDLDKFFSSVRTGKFNDSTCAPTTLSSLKTFEELNPPSSSNHRRNSSCPSADSGYSVIKDVAGNANTRERAATVSNDCVSSTEPSISKHEEVSQDNDEPKPAQPIGSKVESQYQEIDIVKKEDPYCSIEGRHNRRRSSSLSDLQTHKYISKAPHFENVYEDVDELRETMNKLKAKNHKDDPPALPARPLSFSLSAPPQQASPGSKPRADTIGGSAIKSAKKKRFLFGKNRENNSMDGDTQQLVISREACGGSDPIEKSSPSKPRSNIKTNFLRSFSSSTEELIHASDSSSFSELYADINESRSGQGRRRRSSDITPVKQSLLDADILSMRGINRSSSDRKESSPANDPKPPALPQRRHSPPSKPRPPEVEDLIQLFDNTDVTNHNFTPTPNQSPAPNSSNGSPKASPHQPPPASDPLIRFFLDDNLFDENPMVTGMLPVSRPLILPQTLTPSKSFPSFLDSFPSNPNNRFSTSSPNTQALDDNNNNNNNSRSSTSSPVTSPPLNNVHEDISPLNFTNPFAEDLFLWRQAETSVTLPNANIISDGNYLAMSKNSGKDNFFQGRGTLEENVYMTPT